MTPDRCHLGACRSEQGDKGQAKKDNDCKSGHAKAQPQNTPRNLRQEAAAVIERSSRTSDAIKYAGKGGVEEGQEQSCPFFLVPVLGVEPR